MDLEKTYNKWQCTDIEEKYINNIEPTQFTKSELFSFAEFYHQNKVNNGVLDDVISCKNCGSDKTKLIVEKRILCNDCVCSYYL